MTKIERTAVIEPGAEIGYDCYIGHFTLIRSGAKIGNRSEVRAHCFVAPDVVIGEDVKVMQFSNIAQGTVIKDKAWVGPRCMTTNTRKIKHIRTSFDLELTPSTIGYAARIASRVTILPGVKIGDNAFVGADSLVTKDVPDGEVWYGSPATKRCLVPEGELL